MPRKYVKKLGYRANRTYDPAYLERAVAEVRSGRMTMRAASENFAVPYTTLNRKFHGRQTGNYGGQPALTDEEENKLVDVLLLCAEWGFPLKSYDVRFMIQQFLQKSGKREKRFKDNLPGVDWFKCFLLRHRNLTIKLAENTKRVRAAVSYEVVERYFSHLQQCVDGVPPSNIINYDETNFTDDPGAAKVVVRRGAKHAHRIIDASKSSTSVMFAVAGDGTLLPPYVVYKSKYMYPGWTEGGVAGCRYNRTANGWFDIETFEDWFLSVALPYLRTLDGMKVMIGDNLSSHLTVSVVQQCESNNIKFVLLPPNSTHMLQPLDVAYFRPLKTAWRKVLEKWKLRNRGVLPKTIFPRMLKETLDTVGVKSEANTVAGFKACGISPFQPDVVLKKIAHLRTPQQQEEDGHQLETTWCNTIIEHLNQMRTGATEAPKRGKKFNVPAGKSVSVADLVPTIMDDELQITIDQQNDLEKDEMSEEDAAEGTAAQESNSSPVADDQFASDDFEVGDFVIVKFCTNKRDRLFIAKIDSKNNMDTEYTVNVLRKKLSAKEVFFVYPQVPDISMVKEEQIIRKVVVKLFRRGKYVFRNISDYVLE